MHIDKGCKKEELFRSSLNILTIFDPDIKIYKNDVRERKIDRGREREIVRWN